MMNLLLAAGWDGLQIFNAVEVCVWGGIAIAIARARGARGLSDRLRWWLACWYGLFAISDIIEIQTGAFWRPPWLLLLKAVCIIAIVAGMIRWVRRRRSNTPQVGGPA